MDKDSLVNWYIFNEIMKNDDTLFNSSIFLYNDYDGVLHMGPVWDYDLAMGGIDRNDGKNVDPEGFMFLEDYWGKPNWMRYALESTTLQNMIRARWQELYTSGTFEYIVSFLEQQREYLRDAYEVNYSVWHNEGVFVPSDSFDESVDYLKVFIVRRVAWLNSQWNDSGVTAAPVTAEPPATPTPVRTKAPSTPAPTPLPTDAAAETPAEAQRGSGDNEVLNYILIFIGLTAVLVTVILLTYLVISKIKERK
ncbi:MAG: CotH kinase family protein [Clostridia bacterium]|nr:CotH kinase family protein [Clostridia bacterium]